MNKQLELEAEKYARRFEEREQSGYNGESLSIEDRIEMEAFIAGATSDAAKGYWYKQFEKEKIEFAIQQLKSISLGLMDANTVTVSNLLQKINELEQELKQYEQI